MKIGLDLRFLETDLYSKFVLELCMGLIKEDTKNTYTLYVNKAIEGLNFENSKIKKVNIKNGSFDEQFKYNKILKNDKNNIMIFFNHYKPLFYKGLYFTIIDGLKEVYYNNFSNYIKKYTFLHLLEKNIKNSKKILCFDKNTSEELIEKFNLKEENIGIINGFFPNREKLENIEDLGINIRSKYDIKNEYYLYSGGEGVEKNYDKLIYVFEKLKKDGLEKDLVFLGNNIAKNIPLRKLILKLEIQKNIHFLPSLKINEKVLLYKNAKGVIFPSFYEPFPFRLTEPFYFNSNILASDLKSIKCVFEDKIKYFSPISVNSIYESVKKDISTENKEINNYNEISKKHIKEKSIAQVLELIN